MTDYEEIVRLRTKLNSCMIALEAIRMRALVPLMTSEAKKLRNDILELIDAAVPQQVKS